MAKYKRWGWVWLSIKGGGECKRWWLSIKYGGVVIVGVGITQRWGWGYSKVGVGITQRWGWG